MWQAGDVATWFHTTSAFEKKMIRAGPVVILLFGVKGDLYLCHRKRKKIDD
jgi:hypothetical protein